MDRGQIALITTIAVILVVGAIFTPMEGEESAVKEELKNVLESNYNAGADYPARLLILGNADLDSDFDEDDIKVIEMLIANGYDYIEDYFADANYDGVIDQNDIDKVRAMMDYDNFNGIAYYHDVDYRISSYDMSRPLNVANILTQTLEMECILCPENIVATDERCSYQSSMGNFYKEFEYVIDYGPDGKNVGNIGSHKALNPETMTAAAAKYAGGNLTVWMNTVRSYNLDIEMLRSSGVQLVALPSWEKAAMVNGILTAGYLFHKWERANEFVDWYDSIKNDMLQKAAALDDSERKGVLVAYIQTTDEVGDGYQLCVFNDGYYRNMLQIGIVDINKMYIEYKGDVPQGYKYDIAEQDLVQILSIFDVDLIVGLSSGPYNITKEKFQSEYDIRIKQLRNYSEGDNTELLEYGWIYGTGPNDLAFLASVGNVLYGWDYDVEEIINKSLEFLGIYGDEEPGQWSYDSLKDTLILYKPEA